jgi:DNA-directed RNA polymerase specialized sigma24 family protein
MPRAATAASKLGVFDRAFARITEQQRQVILLIGLEGTSYEEAATILDVPDRNDPLAPVTQSRVAPAR